MSDHWKRWRAYADEVEDALRWAADDLAGVERAAARTHGRDDWPLAQRQARREELVRRAMDTPFLGELLRAAARLGAAELAPRHDATLRPWSEPVDRHAAMAPGGGVNLRAIAPPPPGASAPDRLRSAELALAQRTRSLVTVLERLTVPRNASAVMRTAEGLGLQELHFVDPTGRFVAQTAVSKRADQWLDLRQSPRIGPVLDGLHARGYRILAADFDPRAAPLEDVAIDARVAVVFGSEQCGVSAEVRERADGLFYIPVAGFTTYLNVSVAAAIALYALDRRQRVAGLRRPLDDDDRHRLRVRWYRALADGRFAREVDYLRWLHRPPAPDPLQAVAPSREKRRDLEPERTS